jgi:16S rRNA (guanine1207-N2)-methyltransferase
VPGGVLVACAGNDAAGARCNATSRRWRGAAHALSKHRCRACWAVRDGRATGLRAQWLAADAPSASPGALLSRPGVFAWDRIDAASRAAGRAPALDLHGRGADLAAATATSPRKCSRATPA